MLTPDELILIGVIGIALALIFSNRLRADVVALLVLISLAITEIVTPEQALSGFSSSAVIVIMGLFVITRGLEDTGVVQWVADRLRAAGGGSEARLVVLFMATGALLSLIMNNIAAGAVLLPAAVQVARDSNVRPSKILIPLSFGTLVGGMATFFTTANIILSDLLVAQGERGLTMLDFLPTGGLITGAALIYMALIGRRLLPERDSAVGQHTNPRTLARKLYATYQLDQRLWEVEIPAGAEIAGQSLREADIGRALGVTVLAIWRGGHAIMAPEPADVIRGGDYLLVLGREERVRQLTARGAIIGRDDHFTTGGGDVKVKTARRDYPIDLTVDLAEVVIPPRSEAIGKTLADLRFRNKFGLTAIALWRHGRSYRTDVGRFTINEGDALLMVGPVPRIKTLGDERDYIVMASTHYHKPPTISKAPWALLITGLTLAAAILSILPTSIAILTGAVAMILSGALTIDDAYRAIEWRVIFLIAGMLPISIAMLDSGLAGRVGGGLVDALAPFGPLVLIGGLYVLTVLVGQVLGGQVTALVVGPVAVAAALQVGVDPQAVAVATAIACSASFLTPIAHPVNILMMGPGGYVPADFLRVGLGMTILSFVFLLIGMVLFWGIR
ncbi:MAG: SLC13 family permease [Chloroflexi bacterium]|nr:SLC13 family permease [Chloroflexota bacterium]